MKRLTAILLILTLLLLLPACRTTKEMSHSELYALRQEMTAAYEKEYNPASIIDFTYYTNENGYHIVSLPTMLQAVSSKTIAGYTFTFGTSFVLMAYKDGEFIDLKTAYDSGLVSKDAVARAHEAYEERRKDQILWHLKSEYERTYGPVEEFRVYGEDNEHHIVYVVKKDAKSVSSTKTVAGSQFQFAKEASLYAIRDDVFIDLEKAYESGLVSKEGVAKAAELHAEYKKKE